MTREVGSYLNWKPGCGCLKPQQARLDFRDEDRKSGLVGIVSKEGPALIVRWMLVGLLEVKGESANVDITKPANRATMSMYEVRYLPPCQPPPRSSPRCGPRYVSRGSIAPSPFAHAPGRTALLQWQAHPEAATLPPIIAKMTEENLALGCRRHGRRESNRWWHGGHPSPCMMPGQSRIADGEGVCDTAG